MKKLLLLFIALFSLTATESLARELYFCNNELGKLPIQQGGRDKPLYVHANETIKHLTGKRKVDGLSAVEAYCLLSLNGMGIKSDLVFKAPLEHVKTKELIGVSDDVKFMDYEKLVPEFSRLRANWSRLKENDGFKKDLGKLLSRMNLYAEVRDSRNWLVAEVHSKEDVAWVPLANFITEEKVKSQSAQGPMAFKNILMETKQKYDTVVGGTVKLEYSFAKAKLPYISLAIALLALGALTLFKNFTASLVLSFLTILIQTVYLTLRVYISGRAPITNMYETVLFSGYAALFLSLIIGHYRKEKAFVYMGLCYNVCTLFMINFAHGMLNPSISPLVPVLRDNFWLSTHVTTIIISYGALALSWILGNTVLIKKKFFTIDKEELKYYSDLTYTTLKYGTILLAAGIILGGVWADYSWGRFWGWDPKETWSLIVLCLYMAILHGKYTNWIPQNRFIQFTTASFMSVMMAWFGVNYILASGLHSYGFSEGGAIFLGTFFTVQIVVLLITAPAFSKKNFA